MKKFIAMLLVVALTCSNFIGFSGSDTVYASQNSSGLNEDETTVTSATNVSAEKTEITGQGTITDVHVNPLYEDSVEVQSVHYASLDYATSTLSEPEYVADLNVIAEEIREAMLARNNTITVYYKQMGELEEDFLTGWMDIVMVETENPKAGDYLERHYSSAGAQGQYIKYESGLYEYTLTISFTYYTTAEQEEELDEKVAEVLTEIGVSNELTDYENVKKIYDYICGNITYDYDNLNNESYTLKYTAYAALINKTAVCQGYASLFYYMARLSELEVRTIRGTADNGVSVASHGWNIVKLGGKYYYLDSTWDAGRTTYSYFLKGSDNFTDHMSDEKYETSEFTNACPISETDYVPSISEFAGGSGTEADPYIIETKEHLNNVRNHLDASFKMNADITFTKNDFSKGGSFYNAGQGWNPIGDATTKFSGNFDGNEHTISGLYINVSPEADLYYGLFGYSVGTIKNLSISYNEFMVSCMSEHPSSSWDVYVGGIAGYGNVVNCRNLTDIKILCGTTSMSYVLTVGGVVGEGDAEDCSNLGDISAETPNSASKGAIIDIGGVAGWGKVIRCNNSGTIFTKMGRQNIAAGGVTGRTIEARECVNTGNVIGMASDDSTECHVGGVCGVSAYDSRIEKCYNTGYIKASRMAGGIAGGAGNYVIENCFNTGKIDSGWAGGILGDSSTSGSQVIKNCYNAGMIEKGAVRYGIVGDAGSKLNLTNCYCLEGVAQFQTGVKSCTLQEMTVKETFVGFDFDSIWAMNVNPEYSWPELKVVPMKQQIENFSKCEISLDNTKVQYKEIQPQVSVMYNGQQLELNKDFTVKYIIGDTTWLADEYGNRIMDTIGKGEIYVCGMGNYSGVELIEFEVVKFDLANAKLMTPWTSNGNQRFELENFVYDGSAKTQPKFSVYHDDDCISDEYYDITYKNNINSGVATMVITGKGDYYTGTLEKTFLINKAPIDNLIIELSQTTYVYDGTVKMPSVTVKETDGDRLAEGTDYTLSYDTNTKNVGTYKVTVVFKGNYAGAKDLYFKIVPQGQWMHDGIGWWYRNTDGTYPANSWKEIEGARYYFNGSGYMVTGWQLLGGTWYYLSGSGAMVTGWQAIGGTWYYFNGNGAMVTGWQLIGGTWYYFSGSGAMVTGWQAIGGTWYYFHGSGAMATGWQAIGGTWYYFNGSGAMVTGWQAIGNIWYYFHGSGAMAANQWVGNYYLQADGSMAVNKRIGVYYVGADGAWIPGV